MHEDCTRYRGSFQQLADARRVLKVTNSLRSSPVLPADDRLELERIRALAIRTIESATEELIGCLDALHGDADLEDDDPREDDGSAEPAHWKPARQVARCRAVPSGRAR